MELVMTIGPSGCGKTYWSRTYNGLVFDSDALRAELYGDEKDQTHNSLLFKELHRRIWSALAAGRNCCYCATNLSSSRRRSFIKEMHEKFPQVKIIAVVFTTSYDNCLRNIAARERKVAEKVVRRQFNQFEIPTLMEGFDKIIWK